MIIIDTREPKILRDSVRERAAKDAIIVQEDTLVTGDYVWDSRLGSVMVERKSGMDLLGSLTEGRAQDQFSRLIASCDIPILMIEGKMAVSGGRAGRWRGVKKFQAMWNIISLDHTLLSWQMAGLYLARCPSATETPNRIVKLYQWTQKEIHFEGGFRKRKLRAPAGDPPQVATLMTLPGIGAKKARRLLAGEKIDDKDAMQLVAEFLDGTYGTRA